VGEGSARRNRFARAGWARNARARALAALACVAAVVVSACATVPDGGMVSSATIPQKGSQHDVFVQLIPPAPERGWDPALVVSGFLLASASFAGDHAIARQYLTPSAAKSWKPGVSVTEFADTPTVTAGAPGNPARVGVAGTLLGRIGENGQYKAVEQGGNVTMWTASLARVRGEWRIQNPPDQLLLSKMDVSRTFRSRDLYFFDPSMSVLVPDPVYVPAQATTADLVAHLVRALSSGPGGWLADAAKTAFPPGTMLVNTSVAGDTATVNLGGRAGAANGQQRGEMAAQLLQTLAAAPAYPQSDVTPVQSVVLEINGKPVHVSCETGTPPALQLRQCPDLLPSAPGSRVYYVDSHGRVATLTGSRAGGVVPGPAGAGGTPLQKIAVSLDEKELAGVSGNVLYTTRLAPGGSLTPRLTAAGLTTPTWDSNGGLWVAGRIGRQTRVWRLTGAGRPVQVSFGSPIGPVTALRVAPDGVRVAMITGSGASSRLWLAAIAQNQNQPAIGQLVPIGTDVRDFADLSWYDASDVIVLASLPAGPVLYEVPVDGGQSSQISTESGTVSVAASDGGPLVTASGDDTLMQLPDASRSIWLPAGGGQAAVRGEWPVYPG
jgi:Lipoprotein LpqB beta-propeller domain/Sporulation and spore germination